MNRPTFLIGIAALAMGVVTAQGAPQSPPAGAPPAGSASSVADTTPVTPILEAELDPPPGGWTYNPQGRRDPFVSLLKPVGPAGDSKGKPQGIAGFLIQEVALKGIVKTPQGFIAMLLGPDGKSYFCQMGQRLYDGAIIAMDQATVTFRQEVTDPLSPVKTREVKKTLYPSEEARP